MDDRERATHDAAQNENEIEAKAPKFDEEQNLSSTENGDACDNQADAALAGEEGLEAFSEEGELVLNESELSVERTPIWRQGIIILIASIIRALAMDVFIVPTSTAPGGLSGISSILYNTLGWNVSLTLIVMNIPLLILAFFFINKRFAIATAIFTGAVSGFIELFTYVQVPTFTDDVFVASIMGGILIGVSLAMILRINCSAGGTDIVGILLQNRFPRLKTVWLISAADALVAAVAGVVFKSLPITIYSLVTIVVSSYSAEVMQRGFISTYEFKIFTSKEKEIARFVISRLHHGATHISAIGEYTGKPVNYIVCVVRKRQAIELKKFIKQVDPGAFYYVTGVRDVVGKGFNNDVNPTSKI